MKVRIEINSGELKRITHKHFLLEQQSLAQPVPKLIVQGSARGLPPGLETHALLMWWRLWRDKKWTRRGTIGGENVAWLAKSATSILLPKPCNACHTVLHPNGSWARTVLSVVVFGGSSFTVLFVFLFFLMSEGDAGHTDL